MVTGEKLMEDRAEGMSVRAICKKYNISPEKFYQLAVPLGYKVKEIKSKRMFFRPRPTKKWKVQNRVLYGLLLTLGATMKDIAKDIGVSSRTIERWIYEGAMPNDENLKAVCEYFKYPPHILFYEPQVDRSHERDVQFLDEEEVEAIC